MVYKMYEKNEDMIGFIVDMDCENLVPWPYEELLVLQILYMLLYCYVPGKMCLKVKKLEYVINDVDIKVTGDSLPMYGNFP